MLKGETEPLLISVRLIDSLIVFFIKSVTMKKYRLVFVLSILFLGVIKLTASEYEQVRKAPRVHVPVWQSFALSEVELTDSYFKKAMDLHKDICCRWM